MIQHYLEIKNEVQKFNEYVAPQGVIQKIYSTSRYISMSIRVPGKTWHVYWGRGSGYEGLWLHHSPPPSLLRVRDVYLEYLRKFLSASKVLSLSVDEEDRIVRLDYQKFGKKHSLLLFWKARKLFFLNLFFDVERSQLFLSWEGKREWDEDDDLFKIFNSVGRKNLETHQDSKHRTASVESFLKEEEKKLKELTSNKLLKVKKNFFTRKKMKIEKDLEKMKAKSELLEFLSQEDVTLKLQETKIKIGRFEFQFQGLTSPFQKMDVIYKKIKSLRRGELILEDRLQELEVEVKKSKENLSLNNSQSKENVQNILPIISPVWKKESLKFLQHDQHDEKDSLLVESSSPKNNYKVFSFETFSIAVGLNDAGNDEIRNTWAKKEDVWLHLDAIKSAHAIIKLQDNQGLDQSILNQAATLVARLSQFEEKWIPVVFTQVKNIKGVKGSRGKVIFKREKRQLCQMKEDS